MASANLSLPAVTQNLKRVAHRASRYTGIIFIVLLIVMYSFLVWRINTLAASEPSEDAIAEKLQAVQRPRVDENAIEKLKQLEDNSTEVKSLFDQARTNPFEEE